MLQVLLYTVVKIQKEHSVSDDHDDYDALITYTHSVWSFVDVTHTFFLHHEEKMNHKVSGATGRQKPRTNIVCDVNLIIFKCDDGITCHEQCPH